MTEICASILDTIGDTPLIRLNRVFVKPGVQLLAKHEGFNPTGSVKARIIPALLDGYERDGGLRPGMTLVESSSGNTGIGLAMAAVVRGYKCLITMGRRLSRERRQMLRAFGADVVLVDGGSDEAWDRADAIVASDPSTYFRFHQYNSPANARAHYETTGPEIWRQTGGAVDVFVASLGTTGTIMGVGRYLKEQQPGVRIVSVEPALARSKQQGLRSLTHWRVPPIWDPSLVDERMTCADVDALALARRLALEEGIFAGISSGSTLYAAIEQARRLERGTVVFVVPDGGEKYLSTDLYSFSDDPVVQSPME